MIHTALLRNFVVPVVIGLIVSRAAADIHNIAFAGIVYGFVLLVLVVVGVLVVVVCGSAGAVYGQLALL